MKFIPHFSLNPASFRRIKTLWKGAGFIKILGFLGLVLVFNFILVSDTRAALSLLSETITVSAPSARSDHAIRFTLGQTAIPASGKIIFTPQAGAFSIPSGLDYTDIDLLVNGFNRTLASTISSATNAIGVSVTGGANGTIIFTLNDTSQISEGSSVIIRIGTNAISGATGDQQIINPATTGTYRNYIQLQSSSGTILEQSDVLIAIINTVGVTASRTVLATSRLTFAPTTATTTNFYNPDGTKLAINLPANFVNFSDNINLTTDAYEQSAVPQINFIPSGTQAVGKIYDIRATKTTDMSAVTSFSEAITINFYYTDAEISGLQESTLKPHTWTGSSWSLAPSSTVFADENRISVPRSSLSLYTIIGEPVATLTPTPTPGTVQAPGGGSTYSSPPISYISLPSVNTISPATGGTVTYINSDGSCLTLNLPANFWKLPVNFNITSISKKTAISIAQEPVPYSIVGDQIYSILATDTDGNTVTEFTKPGNISLCYTDPQAANFDEQTFKLYSIAPKLKLWEPIAPSVVDTSRNIVSGSITHLTLFSVMGQLKTRLDKKRPADFSQDGLVDLTDFSVLLYNWGKPKNKLADLNNDSKVDLIDFSILLYFWTG